LSYVAVAVDSYTCHAMTTLVLSFHNVVLFSMRSYKKPIQFFAPATGACPAGALAVTFAVVDAVSTEVFVTPRAFFPAGAFLAFTN
jgi:hypothetical protein